jgi:hypothetical protein
MLFTPRAETQSDVRLNLDVKWVPNIQEESYTVKTCDGHTLSIQRAECGFGCRCDAVVITCLDDDA